MKVKTKHNQSLLDLAIQHTGSAETVFLILAANPGLELTTDLAPGQEITIPEEAINAGNSLVRDYYAENNLIPATALKPEEVVYDWLADDDGFIDDTEGHIKN